MRIFEGFLENISIIFLGVLREYKSGL